MPAATATLDEILAHDTAKDLRLNLRLLRESRALTPAQAWGTALASAIASRSAAVTRAVAAEAAPHLTPEAARAARVAGTMMGLTNIYYRFLHLVEDGEYQTMPARLRMNVIANHGIDKLDFELISLAVSAVNGCGLCVTSHEKKLRSHDVSREAIQSAVRIAATIHAVAGVLEFEQSKPAAAAPAELAA